MIDYNVNEIRDERELVACPSAGRAFNGYGWSSVERQERMARPVDAMMNALFVKASELRPRLVLIQIWFGIWFGSGRLLIAVFGEGSAVCNALLIESGGGITNRSGMHI